MTNARNEGRGIAQVTAAMVLSGTIGVFVVESGASSLNVVFFRVVFGALALGAYIAARGWFRGHGFTRHSLALTVLAGLFIVGNWILLFESYGNTSISVASVVYHMQPFFVVVFGALLFRERLTAATLGWVGLAFVGLVLVSGVGPEDLLQGDGDYLLGIGQALGAAVLYGLATLVVKRVRGVRPHLIALVQVVVGIPLLLPFADLGAMSGAGAGAWGWLLALGVFHTGVMYVLMYAAYAELPTAKIAVLAFVYPAVALLTDWLVYGHLMGWLQALGLPLIVWASLRVTLRKPAAAKSAAPAAAAESAPRTDAPRASVASRNATPVASGE
jgi:drug/metabolite transporter (DMT)-like permease